MWALQVCCLTTGAVGTAFTLCTAWGADTVEEDAVVEKDGRAAVTWRWTNNCSHSGGCALLHTVYEQRPVNHARHTILAGW